MTGHSHSKTRVVTLLVLTFTAGLAIGVGGSHLLATNGGDSDHRDPAGAESRLSGADRSSGRSARTAIRDRAARGGARSDGRTAG